MALRYALAITFLSAVADRLGWWGAPGSPNVAWGNYSSFLKYTAVLNPWAPQAMIALLGAAATFAEIALALALMFGFRVKEASLCSAILLAVFAVSMSLTVGIKAPLDYSVFTATAGAFLLYAVTSSKK